MAKEKHDPTAGRPFILTVDPGGANGVCLVERDGLKKLYSDELEWIPLTRYMAGVYVELGDQVDTVVESFRISTFTAKNGPGALQTIEVIGMCRLLTVQYGVGDGTIPLQTPGDASDFTDGKKLRALGWWHKGGAGHANMALRHAALRLLRTGCRDPLLLGLAPAEVPHEEA